MDPTSGITWSIEEITPEQAAFWLEHNPNNRPVAKSTVALYARQMREGKWAVNGEALQFDVAGALMNGQHRLQAVVEAGVTVQMAVVRGLPPSVKDTLDQHRKRTAGDVLAMHGYPNSNSLAGIARVISRWDDGLRSSQLMGGGHLMLTPTEIVAFLDNEPLCVEAARAARTNDAQLLTSARAFGVLWVLTHRAEADMAEEFFRRLTTGEMLEAGSPILTLRRYWLQTTAAGGISRRSRATGTFPSLNAGVRAWNAYARGETLGQIHWKQNAVPEVQQPKVGVKRA